VPIKLRHQYLVEMPDIVDYYFVDADPVDGSSTVAHIHGYEQTYQHLL
jgi:hypothetical protein